MRQLLAFTLVTLTLFSCSAKKALEEEKQDSLIPLNPGEEVVDLKTLDSDGDGISDQDELQAGTNRKVADLPELKVNFLQNYQIKLQYLNQAAEVKEYTIDTKVGRGDANFKYRVGDIFARHNAYKKAAAIGKYSTHHWGSFTEEDLTWVKYPDVDEKFYQKAINDLNDFVKEDLKVKELTVNLENMVRLKENHLFHSIKNLELNFYYFDHQKDDYVLLKTAKIDRHFKAGVNESFSVQIENVPKGLLKDGYLISGEFIISEIKDFEIPDLKTTYKQLMASVREKTIPVVYNTPLDSRVYYVATGPKNAISFLQILETLFDKQVEVSENTIVKVGQFANNLDAFTYLNELKDKDKQGKWFLFTSELDTHYLDYEFSTGDKIALSYILGKELAHQVDERIQAYSEELTGGDDYSVIALGNLSPNSELNLQLFPLRRWGETVSTINRDWHERPGQCGRNTLCGVFEVDCIITQYGFESYDSVLDFPRDFTGVFEDLFLVINDSDFLVKDLIQAKKLEASWINQGLHLRLKNVDQIKELSEADENLISLKLRTRNQTSSQGVRLHTASGQHSMACANVLVAGSFHNGKNPISADSIMMDQIRGMAGQAGVPILPARNYQQHYSLKFNSILSNFHN